MSKLLSGFVFFLPLLISGFCVHAAAEQKIALDIYLADEIAFRSQHAFYMKDMFARLFPELQYRQILVPNSAFGWNKLKTQQKIIEQIKSTVKTDDVIQFLILDTHGNTVPTEQGDVTSLAALGKVGAHSVDPDFDQIFSSIRHQAADNLTVVLNSCSTFCGPTEESEKRARTFLQYFSAPQGRIYGATVKEVDSVYLDGSAFRLKALLPSWKIYLTVVPLLAAAFAVNPLLNPSGLPLNEVLGGMAHGASHGALYLGLPLATLIETVTPIFSWFAGRTWANRGWLYVYQDGKMKDQVLVQKPRDLPAILTGSIRSCQKIHSF